MINIVKFLKAIYKDIHKEEDMFEYLLDSTINIKEREEFKKKFVEMTNIFTYSITILITMILLIYAVCFLCTEKNILCIIPFIIACAYITLIILHITETELENIVLIFLFIILIVPIGIFVSYILFNFYKPVGRKEKIKNITKSIK